MPESSLAVTSAVEVLCSVVAEASGGEVSGFWGDSVWVTGGEAAQQKRKQHPQNLHTRENKPYLVLLLVALAVFFASLTTHLALPQYLGKTGPLNIGNPTK